MLAGDNSILQKATDAKTQTGVGQEKEIIALAYNSALAKKVGEGDSSKINANDLNKEFQNDGKNATAIDSTNNIEITFENGNTYIIENNGNISKIEPKIKIMDFSISGNIAKEEDIPIPTGFRHTEGSKDTGFIIQDEKGNEFIWVPVNKNQTIKLKVECTENIEEIKLYDPFGDEINIGTVDGSKYDNVTNHIEINPTINGTYIVIIKTLNEAKTGFLDVESLYAKNADFGAFKEMFGSEEKINQFATQQRFESKEQMYNMWGVANDTEFIENMVRNLSAHDSTELKKYVDTEDYSSSVNEHGGFYIGRYEATYEDGKAASKKATSIREVKYISGTHTLDQLSNGMLWSDITQTDSLSIAKTYNEKASLLTGAAWDRTLGWLIETGDKTVQDIYNIKDWGNVIGNTFIQNSSGAIKTGEYEQTKSNNIYDLAGNLAEWTTEAYNDTLRTLRGSEFCAGGPGVNERAGENPSNWDGYIGFRLALYL